MDLMKDTKRLLDAYGVSGNEYAASAIAAELLAPFVDEAGVDPWGNVYGYRRCGKPGAKKVMLDAHIDQIGFIVIGFTEEGFVRFQSVSAPEDAIIGREVAIMAKSGIIYGVVGAVPAEETLKTGRVTTVPEAKDLFIDVGMSLCDARAAINVGDFIGFAGGDATELAGGVLAARSTDDRICFITIVRAMELLKDVELNVDITVTGTTKEEFDSAGAKARAWADQPDFAIALDVTNGTPLGAGAVIARGGDSSAKFADRMEEVARAKQFPYVTRSIPEVSGTNGKYFQTIAYGSTTLVMSQPQKYMHTPTELVCMQDIENIGGLLAAFLKTFDGTL